MNSSLTNSDSDIRTTHQETTNTDNDQAAKAGSREVARLHNLAELRRLRNMTQVEVARVMGNTQPSVSAAERAPEISLVHVQRYARALGLEMEVSFYAEGKVVKTWRS